MGKFMDVSLECGVVRASGNSESFRERGYVVVMINFHGLDRLRAEVYRLDQRRWGGNRISI